MYPVWLTLAVCNQVFFGPLEFTYFNVQTFTHTGEKRKKRFLPNTKEVVALHSLLH